VAREIYVDIRTPSNAGQLTEPEEKMVNSVAIEG
jgi:hypothetical protein